VPTKLKAGKGKLPYGLLAQRRVGGYCIWWTWFTAELCYIIRKKKGLREHGRTGEICIMKKSAVDPVWGLDKRTGSANRVGKCAST